MTVISTAMNTVLTTIPVPATPIGAVKFLPPANQGAEISSITFNPTNFTGGSSSTGTIVLSGAAPASGASVSLVSSDPSVTVPASIVVSAGTITANFSVTTAAVSATISVTVTASWNSVSKTAQLALSPINQVSLSSVSVDPLVVTSSGMATGTVTMSAPAPSGGVVVYLWTNGSPAFVPASITVPAGATTANFSVTTNYESSNAQGTITAFYNGFSKTTTITVTPPATLLSVSTATPSVAGSLNPFGTVNLTEPAPPGGLVVYLWTNGSPAFVPTSVTVAPGALAATFTVTTVAVASSTPATITAFYEGSIETTTLTVTP